MSNQLGSPGKNLAPKHSDPSLQDRLQISLQKMSLECRDIDSDLHPAPTIEPSNHGSQTHIWRRSRFIRMECNLGDGL